MDIMNEKDISAEKSVDSMVQEQSTNDTVDDSAVHASDSKRTWLATHAKNLIISIFGLIILGLSLYIVMDRFEVFTDLKDGWKTDSDKILNQQLVDSNLVAETEDTLEADSEETVKFEVGNYELEIVVPESFTYYDEGDNDGANYNFDSFAIEREYVVEPDNPNDLVTSQVDILGFSTESFMEGEIALTPRLDDIKIGDEIYGVTQYVSGDGGIAGLTTFSIYEVQLEDDLYAAVKTYVAIQNDSADNYESVQYHHETSDASFNLAVKALETLKWKPIQSADDNSQVSEKEFKVELTSVSGGTMTDYVAFQAPEDGNVIVVPETSTTSAGYKYVYGDFDIYFYGPPHMSTLISLDEYAELDNSGVGTSVYRMQFVGRDTYYYGSTVLTDSAKCKAGNPDATVVTAPCAASTPVIVKWQGSTEYGLVTVRYEGTDVEMADQIVESLTFYQEREVVPL